MVAVAAVVCSAPPLAGGGHSRGHHRGAATWILADDGDGQGDAHGVAAAAVSCCGGAAERMKGDPSALPAARREEDEQRDEQRDAEADCTLGSLGAPSEHRPGIRTHPQNAHGSSTCMFSGHTAHGSYRLLHNNSDS